MAIHCPSSIVDHIVPHLKYNSSANAPTGVTKHQGQGYCRETGATNQHGPEVPHITSHTCTKYTAFITALETTEPKNDFCIISYVDIPRSMRYKYRTVWFGTAALVRKPPGRVWHTQAVEIKKSKKGKKLFSYHLSGIGCSAALGE